MSPSRRLLLSGALPLVCAALLRSYPAELPLSEQQRRKIRRIVDSVSARRLAEVTRSLSKLPTRHSATGQQEAARLIEAALRRLSVTPTQSCYTAQGQRACNLIVRFVGRRRPDVVHLLVAHYDSLSERPAIAAPGADDNASGVAILVECARLLRAWPPETTVELLFSSYEEQEHLGSRAYVEQAQREKRRFTAVLNVDTVAFSDASRAQYFRNGAIRKNVSIFRRIFEFAKHTMMGTLQPSGRLVVGGKPTNAGLARVVSAAARRFSSSHTIEMIGKQCGCGDEGRFWEAGYDAVYVMSATTNPNNHRSTDNFATVDLKQLRGASKAVIAGLFVLDALASQLQGATRQHCYPCAPIRGRQTRTTTQELDTNTANVDPQQFVPNRGIGRGKGERFGAIGTAVTSRTRRVSPKQPWTQGTGDVILARLKQRSCVTYSGVGRRKVRLALRRLQLRGT